MPSKRILIVFPYGNLAYSPTTLEICQLLISHGHKVKLIYGFEEFWGERVPPLSGVDLESRSYSHTTIRVGKHINKFLWQPISKFLQRLSILNLYNRLSVREILFSSIVKKALRENVFDELIVVDLLPLYWAHQLGIKCHLISLEVDDALQLLDRLDIRKIKSVVIQSNERFERILGKADIRHFLIQNAPTYSTPATRTRPSKKLIYNGTVWPPFGALDMIRFVKAFPEYSLHLKGNVHKRTKADLDSIYRPLVSSGSLTYSDTYLNNQQLREYLANYSIGFCLYNFADPLIAERRFNYETAPSGKVFLYLSIGMPVVATRIRGFDFIEQRAAGVLIDDHEPGTIRLAVDTILNDYETFSNNALALGKDFSFDAQAKPFIDFISQ
ncbi:MAG: hypothetical protein HY961_09445 [Ignavibacteriae bacterium]|nr:hypothetical protein [Ignavibacteriota bacterium]